jgi:hypothetical protein
MMLPVKNEADLMAFYGRARTRPVCWVCGWRIPKWDLEAGNRTPRRPGGLRIGPDRRPVHRSCLEAATV